jgi:signal transduction histidine kinase
MTFPSILAADFAHILTYAPLTPFVFALGLRFPIRRDNWVRRASLHLLFAVAFSLAHIVLMGLTPYAAWDPKLGAYVSAFWNSQTHLVTIKWQILRNLFLAYTVDDITGAYIPIVLVAHALSYYWRLRDRELHSAKLETQLARAHLQALKSNLQPHFLFNTMHSISALMLMDVKAADKMMTRLSALLRMSLETSAAQVIRLSRELEFVDGYLQIEKMRLRERLRCVFDIAPDTLDAQVPSLLLQPLVENAIRHGLARLSSGGTIWVTSAHRGTDLYLQVSDNGVGLTENSGTPPGTGFGLRMTRERLRTMYGNNQSFEIESGPEGGVNVRISIPFRVEHESLIDPTNLSRVENAS